MHSPDKHCGTPLAARAALALLLAALAGCSSTPSSDAGAQRAESGPAAEVPAVADDAQASEQAPAVPQIERRRRDYPELETDDTGFTITEQIRIGGEVRAEYQRALLLLRQERYEQGIPLLVAVTELAPDITAPHIDLGIAYGRSGQNELAENALLMASQLSPDHPIVYNELGILYRRTGRFPEARAAYEQALSIYPAFHFARRNLAVLCDLYLADLECALEHYETYLESVTDDEEVGIWVADIRNRLGQ